MTVPHHSTHIKSAMEECGQMITASLGCGNPQKEIWIWLWSCYFVSTAVLCTQLTADSSLQTPSFFILSLDTPCPPFIIHSPFTLSTHPSLLQCFWPPYHSYSFYHSISSSKNLSNLKVYVYLHLAPISQLHLNSPSLPFPYSMPHQFPCSSVIKKWLCFRAFSIDTLLLWQQLVQVGRLGNKTHTLIVENVLWLRVRLNLWPCMWEAVNAKPTAAPAMYVYIVIIISYVCVCVWRKSGNRSWLFVRVHVRKHESIKFLQMKNLKDIVSREKSIDYKLWPISIWCLHSVKESQGTILHKHETIADSEHISDWWPGILCFFYILHSVSWMKDAQGHTSAFFSSFWRTTICSCHAKPLFMWLRMLFKAKGLSRSDCVRCTVHSSPWMYTIFCVQTKQ